MSIVLAVRCDAPGCGKLVSQGSPRESGSVAPERQAAALAGWGFRRWRERSFGGGLQSWRVADRCPEHLEPLK